MRSSGSSHFASALPHPFLIGAPGASAGCRGGGFAPGRGGPRRRERRHQARLPVRGFDGSTSEHSDYVRCAKGVIDTRKVLGAYSIRSECRRGSRRVRTPISGHPASANKVSAARCRRRDGPRPASNATLRERPGDRPERLLRVVERRHLAGTRPTCRTLVVQETVNIPSVAAPAETPGSPGVVVTHPGLLTQFGGPSFTLNQARYTRHRLAGPEVQPDAILILVPGFEGGAGNFKIFAENLIPRAAAGGQIIEVWAVDRRTNQLEDLVGNDIAEEFLDPRSRSESVRGELGLTSPRPRRTESPRHLLQHAGRSLHRQLDVLTSRRTSTR